MRGHKNSLNLKINRERKYIQFSSFFRMLKVIALLCVIGLSSQASLQTPNSSGYHKQEPANWTKPWFCHELDCPVYTVLETNDVSHSGLYLIIL